MNSPAPTIDETALPPQLSRLVRAPGWDRTWCPINARGGQCIKLPQRHNDVRLAELIGADGVQRLRDEFPEQAWMDVP